MSRDVTIYIAPNPGAAAVTNEFRQYALEPDEMITVVWPDVLNVGDKVRWFASVASQVTGRFSVQEIAA